MTIYDNDRPFGLMSQIDQGDMKAHYDGGGKIVCYSSFGTWDKVLLPSWLISVVYRAVKPDSKPITVLVPDALPDWPSIYLAKDSWGNVCMSNSAMLRGHYSWNPQNGARFTGIPGDPFRIVDVGNVDWKDSLIRVK